MIYTSYFGKIRKLPENFLPICIANVVPKFFKGPYIIQLAPRSGLLRWWYSYADHDSEADQQYYTERFMEQLNELDARGMDNTIHGIAKDKVPVLVCYEKDGFCHRHLVARWLNDHGIWCKEWEE